MNFKQLLHHSRPQNLFKGLGVLPRGLGFSFKNKSYLFLALIPVLSACVSLYFFYSVVFSFFYKLLLPFLEESLKFDFWGGFVIEWIALFGVKVFIGLFVFILFYILLQIVYIPICSVLSERVLKDKGIIQTKSLLDFLKFNFQMFKIGLFKAFILVFLSLFCFLVSFFPPLSFVPLYFALVVMSYDSFDYGLELFGMDLKERFIFARKETLLLNGHAGVLFFCSFIPGLILLSLPFSVIGASLILGEMQNGLKKEAS